MPQLDIDVSALIARARERLHVGNDRELAAATAIKYDTLASWKKRKSISLQGVAALAGKASCSIDWLVFGENKAGTSDRENRVHALAVLRALYTSGLPQEKRKHLAFRIAVEKDQLLRQIARMTEQDGYSEEEAFRIIDDDLQVLVRSVEGGFWAKAHAAPPE